MQMRIQREGLTIIPWQCNRIIYLIVFLQIYNEIIQIAVKQLCT